MKADKVRVEVDERFRKGFKNDLKARQGREKGVESELIEEKVSTEEADLLAQLEELNVAEEVSRTL